MEPQTTTTSQYEEPIAITKGGRLFDYRILRFRFEVLREDIFTIAESVGVDPDVLHLLARSEGWKRIDIDDTQEHNIQNITKAAKLRLHCLTALRQLERFYKLAELEDDALNKIKQLLQTDLTATEVFRLVKCLKSLGPDNFDETLLARDIPEPVKGYIDIRRKQRDNEEGSWTH